jgi:hypothetical protein
MKEIPLTNSTLMAIVDDEDHERVSQYTWWLQKSGYVRCSRNVEGRTVRLHNFIMQPPDGYEVDHRDRNKLDNRRSNLRICTEGQNLANRAPYKLRGKERQSRFKGVKVRKGRKGIRYDARINDRSLGAFATEEAAAEAYNAAATRLYGEFAYLNDVATNAA